MTPDDITPEGYALLEEFEDFRAYPYPDPASALYRAAPRARWGLVPAFEIIDNLDPEVARLPAEPWTQGFGFTSGIHRDSPAMTREEARARLRDEVRHYADGVRRALTRPANANQLSAMVVLAFNIGIAGFARSTVLKAHNRGDFDAAARAFGLWNKAGGRELRGLTRRRAAESALYLKPVRVEIPVLPVEREELPPVPIRPDLEDAMPQTIDIERPMRQSTIVRGASISGGVAGVTLAAEGARAVADIRSSLGDWLPYIALAVVVVAAGWIIWERLKQRRGGWA